MFWLSFSSQNNVSDNLLSRLIIVFAGVILYLSPLSAANTIDVQVTSNDQHDTLWAGFPGTFDIYIENDVRLAGMILGFQFWSDNGGEWEWFGVPGGWGPDGQGTGFECISIVPGCRLDPISSVFDMTQLIVYEHNVDQLMRDSILIGGVGVFTFLESGPLEHMLSINFIPHLDHTVASGEICIDTAFIPPSGSFAFADVAMQTFPPTIPWEYGARCWPVKRTGYAGIDGDIVIDPDPFYAYYAFSLDRPTFIVHLGNFSAGYDANYLIAASLIINGSLTPQSATRLESYPGFSGEVWELTINSRDFIDLYPIWWDTLIEDIHITGEFGDATALSAFGQFMAIGHRSGDANGDGTVNVGDIVVLIDYVFRGGDQPRPPETGDANASGNVDLGDAVYLIQYIFGDGPKPQHP